MYDSYLYIVSNEGIDTARYYPYLEQVRRKLPCKGYVGSMMNLFFCSNLTASTLPMGLVLRYLALFRSRVEARLIFSLQWPMSVPLQWLWMPTLLRFG